MSKKDPFGTKRQCCMCGKLGTEENPVYYTQDPYNAEINEIYHYDWECSECLDDSAGDI